MHIIKAFFSKTECKKLIRLAKSQKSAWLTLTDEERSLKEGHLIQKRDPNRIAKGIDTFSFSDVLIKMISTSVTQKIEPAINVQVEFFEPPQLLCYGPGGLYQSHADSEEFNATHNQWVKRFDRDISLLIYINDKFTNAFNALTAEQNLLAENLQQQLNAFSRQSGTLNQKKDFATQNYNVAYQRAQEVHDSALRRYDDTLADVAEWFRLDEQADSAELADTIRDMQARYDANHAAHLVLEGLITDSLNHHRSPIIIDLHTGWNTVAYYLHHPSPVVAQFVAQFGSPENVDANINIVKNNEGLFYWPEFLFDGLGMLQPGQGYQVRVTDSSPGNPNFFFDHAIGENEYRVLTPTVPAWALEMEVETHPNDIRTLVRVVNMLGQEVVPSEQFAGEILLYMFNDGTVEKKMVQ